MSRFERESEAERGRGTGKTPLSSSAEINREKEENIFLRETETALFSVPRPRLNPRSMMPFVVVSEREFIRHAATARDVVCLDRATRRAAAADPGLVWVPGAHRYRRKGKGDV